MASVGVDYSEHRDTEAVSLTHCDVLIHHVDNEQSTREASQVSDRTEVLLQLSALTLSAEGENRNSAKLFTAFSCSSVGL